MTPSAGSQPKFQFALPRGERPAGRLVARPASWVSIRAPAWGATRCGQPPQKTKGVSIRAPAWGATIPAHRDGKQVVVSIRAPAWGATVAAEGVYVFRDGFNSRSRVGSDGNWTR